MPIVAAGRSGLQVKAWTILVRVLLGITINEAEIKKHPFQQELAQQVFYPDGSVGDW